MTDRSDRDALKQRISELEKSLDQLRRRERRYNQIFLNSTNALAFHDIVPDKNGQPFAARITEVNPAFERITGLEKEDILGRTMADLFPEWAAGFDLGRYRERQDGKIVLPGNAGADHLNQIIFAFHTFSPETGRLITRLIDITAQARTQQALEKNEQMLATLVANLPGITYRCLCDENWTMIYLNQGSTAITGYRPDELIGDSHPAFNDLIFPRDKEKVRRTIARAVKENRPFTLEYRIIHRDGQLRWIREKGRCTRSMEDAPLLLEGFIYDITDLKTTQLALSESESQYRQLVDTIPDLVWLKDRDGVYLSCNKTFEAFFGADEERILGKTDRDFVDPGMAEFFRRHDKKAMDEDRICINEERLTFARTGYQGLFETLKTPMKDTDGRLIGVLGIGRDISNRKKMENALRLSQQKLRFHLQQTPLAVIEMSPDFTIRTWNPAAGQLFGYTREEALGRHIDIIIPTEDHPHIQELFVKLVNKKSGMRSTGRNVDKAGNLLFCEWFNTPVVDDSGNTIAVVALGQDITQRRQAEEALKVNEERYRELFNNMSSGVAVYTALDRGQTFIVKDLNRAGEEITKATRKEVLGKEALDAFPGLATAGILKDFKTAHTDRKSIYRQALFYRDHKIGIWVEHNVYPLPSGEIVSVFNDISTQIETEQTLHIERDKLKSVINGIGESLYIVDNTHVIEYQNELSIRRFGDQTGQQCHAAFFDLDTPCEFCGMAKSLKEDRVIQVETGALHKKTYEISFSPFLDASREGKTVVLLRDITEKRFLQAEALRAGHLASLGELAAGVAHEINNPVTGIIGIAEVLTDKFHSLGGDRRIPERIINEGERISRIVKNLLSFARAKKEDFSPVGVDTVLTAALELVEKQLFKDGIHLDITPLPDLPKVRANDQEIQQVFLNIISNARYAVNEKYPDPHPDKRLEIAFEIVESEAGTFIRTGFKDSGTGIPKKMHTSITDPFFSTKPQGEGTGLGLSISHGIINNHGGRLLFDSREGLYTHVMVDLPAVRPPKPPRDRTENREPTQGKNHG